MRRQKMQYNKYHNKKCEFNGDKFDSKKELKRWQELLLLEKFGTIRYLERQKRFLLINPIKVSISIDKVDIIIKKESIRACEYITDFYYQDEFNNWIAEDTKGFAKKPEYIIKRKLFLQKYPEIIFFENGKEKKYYINNPNQKEKAC